MSTMRNHGGFHSPLNHHIGASTYRTFSKINGSTCINRIKSIEEKEIVFDDNQRCIDLCLNVDITWNA